MRDYLAEIYRLSGRTQATSGYVSTSALAEIMDVSAPAVNRMVTKLRDYGLLHHEPYQGISLTEAGTKEALIALRRHRIAEAFLVNVMGFEWHEIHEEAHRIGGAMSEAITLRMAEMAGQPTHCPHGEPIPAPDGTLKEPGDVLLSEVEAERTYTVSRVLTREPERLEYIKALTITPGTTLEVLHVAPFNGPMQLKLGDAYRIIGHNLAELIRVLPQQA
jgi:DtxR family Mn-dependent transcriptional regulator